MLNALLLIVAFLFNNYAYSLRLCQLVFANLKPEFASLFKLVGGMNFFFLLFIAV